jgi:hypothetical protein
VAKPASSQVTVLLGKRNLHGRVAEVEPNGLRAAISDIDEMPIGELVRLRVEVLDSSDEPFDCVGWIRSRDHVVGETVAIQFFAMSREGSERWTAYYHGRRQKQLPAFRALAR